MYCVKCGKEIPNGSKFCGYCGGAQPQPYAPAVQQPYVPASQQPVRRQPMPQPPSRPPQRPKKQKGKKGIVISICCVWSVVLILAGVILYLELHRSPSHPASEANLQSEPQESVPETFQPQASSEAETEPSETQPPETEPATEPSTTEPSEKQYHFTYNYVDFDVPESGYILPDSSTRLISESELYSLTEHQCCLARNELFARHGRKFTMPEIAEYFNAMDWYQGTVEGAAFDANIDAYLNAVERENLKTIREYEKKMGW